MENVDTEVLAERINLNADALGCVSLQSNTNYRGDWPKS